jgi:hypothetical protein
MKARIQAGNQLVGLLARAPEELRTRLRKLRGRNLVEAALALEPAPGMPVSVAAATQGCAAGTGGPLARAGRRDHPAGRAA